MEAVALVTLLLLMQYFYFSLRAGMMRGKFDVKAPAISGHETFDRALRVQVNTLEQLIITIPAMWICAHTWNASVAAGLGVVFLIGRFVYSHGYLQDPNKRAPGMIIGAIANVTLMVGGLITVAMKLL
ncbi:MAG: MAPEG family protein [Gammaproteobacteria bacterium]|nr:MAPEG family protein [Gammaproteobacteria bacterium]